ncbi:hypothetical protein L210DRAFT_2024593 [Boletus edulis BED1]|uniref:Uncharacterized protein n=1 Tax=Boletus edulis BED1 TaxID=1328754 RepID=A0AAD4C877_BOLED|nr:hypothetical protein L210DRAFT_2024593 [Boletus edulis BED1]
MNTPSKLFFFASPWENCRWQSACSRHLLPPGRRPSSCLSQPPVLRVGHPNVHMPTCPCLTSTCSNIMSPLSSANHPLSDTPTHRVKRRPRSNVTVDRGCWTVSSRIHSPGIHPRRPLSLSQRGKKKTGLIPWRARKPRSASWMDWQPSSVARISSVNVDEPQRHQTRHASGRTRVWNASTGRDSSAGVFDCPNHAWRISQTPDVTPKNVRPIEYPG